MNPEVIPPPRTVPVTSQELITPATVIVAPNESTQPANPSQLGAAKAIPPRPQSFKQQPAGDTAVNAPLENTLPPSAHDGATGLNPTNALSAPPSVPAPALAPPAKDDDEEDDDNNLLKAHRRVRAKRNILVGGPMKWMPEEVAYGLKEALKDLKEANRKAKKRLLSRKKPISTTAASLIRLAAGAPAVTITPVKPSSKEQTGPSASGGDDGAAKTAESVANDDDDDLLPPGWAMGEDEVGGGLSDFVATPADNSSTEDGPATALDSMLSKMSIGNLSAHTGSSLPAPAPQVAVN
ncbi:hypothetical protein INS49_007313 [Diaporthe citri]|uniref:uncharacterized protein n=1 Tax=Diaporthe citri TaxID=83186 RepID=UPI001C81615B|nr:uncharacterized protein INS49_007313 [Diaporthe citri]KAG6365702.1 hypothetical protein INS49_007313 [Diaporthe citri]